MGIIVNKENDKNTELNRRIDAELRESLQNRAADDTDPDLVDDSDYTRNLQKTSRFGWVWIVLIILALMSLMFICFF